VDVSLSEKCWFEAQKIPRLSISPAIEEQRSFCLSEVLTHAHNLNVFCDEESTFFFTWIKPGLIG
jgi:hypothetical protein